MLLKLKEKAFGDLLGRSGVLQYFVYVLSAEDCCWQGEREGKVIEIPCRHYNSHSSCHDNTRTIPKAFTENDLSLDFA